MFQEIPFRINVLLCFDEQEKYFSISWIEYFSNVIYKLLNYKYYIILSIVAHSRDQGWKSGRRPGDDVPGTHLSGTLGRRVPKRPEPKFVI